MLFLLSSQIKSYKKEGGACFPNLLVDRVTDPTLRHTADDETTGFNTEIHAVWYEMHSTVVSSVWQGGEESRERKKGNIISWCK